MAVDATPWASGDPARPHSAETARALAYAAFGGGDGVAAPGDCKVSALATPGTSVRIGPGVLTATARAAGGRSQNFVGRVISDELLAPAATTSAGGRSDLIAMVFRDPTLSGTGGTAGQPGFVPIIVPNVPATTTKLQEIPAHQFTTGYALARIDIPVSTSTFTNAMIKDLRKLANPRSQRSVRSIPQGGGTAAGTRYNPLIHNPGFGIWPPTATWDVDIPIWATHAVIVATISQYTVKSGDTNGQLKVTMSGLETPVSSYDENYLTSPHRNSVTIAGEIVIPEASKGTPDLLRVMGKRTSWTTDGALDADGFTQTILDLQFVERIV